MAPSPHATATAAATALLLIPTPASGAPLSPGQKRFNQLTQRVSQARERLQAWQAGVDDYSRGFAEQVQPLVEAWQTAEREWVLALGGLLASSPWPKGQRDTLRALLCEAAEPLLDRTNDPAIRALFDQHAGVDYDTLQQQRLAAMKLAVEDLTGLDLGDLDEVNTEAGLMARVRQGMADAEQARAEAQAARAARAAARRAAKGKAAPPSAASQRALVAQQTTQSLREIYRKLASALHPDREPDPARREAKTALMQQVNQAHEARDLLTLLSLQWQIEQMEGATLAQASEQRLAHYNQVLAEQLEELERASQQAEAEFCARFGVQANGPLHLNGLDALLAQAVRHWQALRAEQQHRLQTLQDPEATRRWVKRQKQRRRQGLWDGAPG